MAVRPPEPQGHLLAHLTLQPRCRLHHIGNCEGFARLDTAQRPQLQCASVKTPDDHAEARPGQSVRSECAHSVSSSSSSSSSRDPNDLGDDEAAGKVRVRVKKTGLIIISTD